MSLFINRFCELTKKSGKMQKDICTDLGIKEQKFTKKINYINLWNR